MNSIFKQDGDFFEQFYSGDLITRATGDTNMISRISTYTLFHFVDTITMLVVAFVSMITLDVSLTFYAIIPLPLILVIVLYLRPKIMRNWKLVRKEVSHLNNLVMESVTHVKLVRGFVKEDSDEKKLADSAEIVYKTERKSVLMQAFFMPSFRTITTISQVIALAYGSYLIMNQMGFSVGNLVTFNLYLAMFARPLFRLGNQITQIAQSGISFDRVNEIMNAVPTIKDKIDAIELEYIDKIEFQDLSFRYPLDKEFTIRDINITVLKGQTLGIVGKTGSGKTTLLKQLLRQFVISEGNVYLNDLPIDGYKKMSVRSNIAYVPQEHALFSRTVLENLELGIGDNINVYKANMIIPQISDNITRSGNIEIPEYCPVCGGKTAIKQESDVKSLYCTNDDCLAKQIKMFTHFVGRDAMNIEGLSGATIEKLIAKGLIKELADIFHIEKYKEEIIEMEGFGDKSFNKLVTSVNKSRKTSAARLLYSLGIPNVGLSNAKLICKNYKYDWNSIENATFEQLIEINGIGDVMADAYVKFFGDEKKKVIIEDVLKEIELEVIETSNFEQIFERMNFVITGSVEQFKNRDELKEIIDKGKWKGTLHLKKHNSKLYNAIVRNIGFAKAFSEIGLNYNDYKKMIIHYLERSVRLFCIVLQVNKTVEIGYYGKEAVLS